MIKIKIKTRKKEEITLDHIKLDNTYLGRRVICVEDHYEGSPLNGGYGKSHFIHKGTISTITDIYDRDISMASYMDSVGVECSSFVRDKKHWRFL